MTTLVLCLDRSAGLTSGTDAEAPVTGRGAVRSLVLDAGVADPEDSRVNCLLETLRVADRTDGDVVAAVVAGAGDSAVGVDRSVAEQVDALVGAHDPDSAVVVLGGARDEQLIPVVESRVPVDAVDRVVVRQAHDIESTYYLLKQFLADGELRSTVLVPLGVGLLVAPALLLRVSVGAAVAGLAALAGAALLYEGLAVADRAAAARERAESALYAGRVSVVTYVAAAALALVGVSLGVLDAPRDAVSTPVAATHVLYTAVPALAVAALTATAGRVLDAVIGDGSPTPFVNLAFGVGALALVVRGVSGYVLEREGVLPNLVVAGAALPPLQRLAGFLVAAVVVSLVGVRVAAGVSDETIENALE